MRRLLLAGCAVLCLNAQAWALDLSYTLSGYGGFSQPVPGFSDAPFPWIDWTGQIPSATLTSYGFNPVLPGTQYQYEPDQALGGGSLLLSSPFYLDAGQTLTVTTALLTSLAPYEPADVEFTLLLHEAAPPMVLSNLRQDGGGTFFTYFTGDGMPWNVLTPPSAGVTTTYTPAGAAALAGIVLGDAPYGVVNYTGACGASCLATVTSSVNPDAGTYRLLFGAYHLFTSPDRFYDVDDGHRIDRPIALAVKAVNVPEPATGLFLVMSLGLVVAWRAWRWQR